MKNVDLYSDKRGNSTQNVLIEIFNLTNTVWKRTDGKEIAGMVFKERCME